MIWTFSSLAWYSVQHSSTNTLYSSELVFNFSRSCEIELLKSSITPRTSSNEQSMLALLKLESAELY